MRNDSSIPGIEVNGKPHKINQFADDTSLKLRMDQSAISAIFKKLEWFRTQSGMQISYDKTSIYRIGSVKRSNAQLYTQTEINWTKDGFKLLGILITDENIRDKNIEPTIQKAYATLKSWKNRDLSLLGKVTVVNSLIASLFVHQFKVLPNMSDGQISRIEGAISNFVWNNAKPKIALRTLQLSKKAGGLNLVNLRHRQTAIKCTWIQALHKDTKCADLAFSLLAPTLKFDIFKCNLSEKDMEHYKCPSIFWKEMLGAWMMYVRCEQDSSSVCAQTLWWNSRIRINDKPVLWKKAYNRSLLWVSQLYEHNQLIGAETAEDKFYLSYMEYFSLLSAIPREWKVQLQSDVCMNISLYEKSLQCKKLSQKIYGVLSGTIPTYENKLRKWNEECEAEMCRDDMLSVLWQTFKLTNVPKLRSFQYRLTHRALVLNSHLYRWKMRDDNLCSFCMQQKETLAHLFVKCKSSYTIWENLRTELYESRRKAISIEPIDILWNGVVKKKNSVANFLTLVTKQYIYSCRCANTVPSYTQLKSKIKSIQNTELYIAKKNGKECYHNAKWENLF